MPDPLLVLKEWLERRLSPVDWIAFANLGIWKNLIYVEIITETPDYDDPQCPAKFHDLGLALDAEIQRAYPTFKPVVDIKIPSEGSTPEEMRDIPPEQLIIVDVVAKHSVQ